MRKTITAIVLAASIPAAQAEAHTLSLRGADRVATRDAEKILREIPRHEDAHSTVGRCKRRSPHTVDCRANFYFITRGKRCSRTIRVRFPTKTRKVRITYPGDVVCHPL